MDKFERKMIGNFEYNLVRQEAKQTKIIQDRNGTIWCYVSSHIKEDEIEREIQRHAVKIFRAKKSLPPASLEDKSFVDGEDFQYLGDNYRLKIIKSHPEAISLQDNYFYLNEGPIASYDQIFKDWYIKQGQRYFLERVSFFLPQLDVTPQKVLVSDLDEKWGICTPKGIIKLNWKLIMLSPEIVDYVIVHELVHLKHLNHSQEFWAEVEFVLPSYKNQLRRLDNFENTS